MSETSSALLLRLRDHADHAAWSRLVTIYTPLLTAWIRRAGVAPQDADDLVQEVLLAAARELPGFRYDRSQGSFRGWLRSVLIRRIRHHQRGRNRTTTTRPLDDALLDSLEDPASDLSREWDAEHDGHVAAGLLETARPDFAEQTWVAFTRIVMDGEKPAAVAADLGMSLDAVYQARSRVLARLRQEADGLLD
jgi:RNA polymerase sigma factor (sigma-70 family)